MKKESNKEVLIKNVVKDMSVTVGVENTSSELSDEEKRLDELICRADLSDYLLAAASGLTCGLIDAFFTKDFSLLKAHNWGAEKVNSIVVKIAKKQGCKSNKLPNCINYLENKNPYPSDSLANEFGGGLNHHLRDFTHHFGMSGIVFSIISQFTGKVYGADVNGNLIWHELDSELIGNSIPEKLFISIVEWLRHMASDIAGSSNSTRAGKTGSGLPGPIISFVKRLSASKLFGRENSEVRKKVSVTVAKLFNGTLIRDNGVGIKFDFRTELGLAAFEIERSFSVLLNSLIVSAFYFVKRLSTEFDKCGSFEDINWKKVLPYKNPTITRMMVVSSGVMTAIDMARFILFWKHDKSTLHANSIASINIIGLGTFVFSLSSEIKYAIQRKRTVKKILKDNEERNALMDTQTLLYINKQWIIADTRRKIIFQIAKAISDILLHTMLLRVH